MKNAMQWSITALGVLCLVFFLGIYYGRSSMTPPEKTNSSVTVASESQQSGTQAVININTADASQLQTLPGIGETLANRIIEYRNANGPFTNTLQLKLVEGIGDGKMEEIIQLICVEDTQ